VTGELATDALGLLEIDERGLDAMTASSSGRSPSPRRRAGRSGDDGRDGQRADRDDRDVVEPYLMQIGLLARTPRAGSSRRPAGITSG
jgi:Holliday junction resolvasome RuvABC ATP-dependent DNA helicase subunit